MANGLKAGSGLKTVNLAICLAAQGPKGIATVSGPSTMTAAVGSAVDRLAKALTKSGHRGIKITGSNEIVQDVGGRIFAAVLSRTLAHPLMSMQVDRGPKGAFIIRIPNGWTVVPGSPVKLIPPKKHKLAPDDTNKSKKPAGGWLVQSPGADFFISQGWHVQPGGVFGTTTILVPYGLDGESNGPEKGGTLSLTKGFQGQVREGPHSYFKAHAVS